MTAPTTTPSAVRNATLAVWGILALVVLRAILTVVFEDDLVDAWIESNEGAQALPREFVADGAPKYTAISIGVLVLGVVLAVAAMNLSKRARWARVLVYVFASLCLVGTVLTFLAPSLPMLLVVNALVAVLSIAAIALLSTGEANRFFAA
jgi:hypothetical protein